MTLPIFNSLPPQESAPLLLLEDDGNSTVKELLSNPEWPIQICSSSAEALGWLKMHPAPLALVPGDNADAARDFIRLLRKEAKHLPILVLGTGTAEGLSESEAYAGGATDYVPQPVVSAALPAKIRLYCALFQEKQAARHEAVQLHLVLEATVDYAIFMLDPQGYVQTWNAGAQRIKGYRDAEIIGQHFSVFYPPEALAQGLPQHALQTALQAGRFENEGWRIRRNHTRFWANVIITPLRNATGQLIGFSKITRDLTERREAEESLRAAQAELESRVLHRTEELARANIALREADRCKDDFLAMFAHEIRNPLAPLRNALQILKLPHLDPAIVHDSRNMMERQVEHLVRLVDELIDASRMMRGKIRLQMSEIKLADLFAQAVETVEPVIDSHGQNLEVLLPPEPISLQGDMLRLSQVIGNLLTNAARYNKPAGQIWLSAHREGSEAVIRVKDTGVGIDSGLLPRIFDLFVQAERSLERAQGGLGIGLTLVRRLVELHGGTVSAQSAGIDLGSEFTVRLPALPPQHAHAEDQEVSPEFPSAASPAPESRRILVVDDNVDAAESTALLLRVLGHRVTIAHSGPAALEAVTAFRPQVVLLDIGLPGMNGYEVARTLRAQPQNQGLILAAVTGYGQDEDRRLSQVAGFDQHLTKPLAPALLAAVVNTTSRRYPSPNSTSG